MNDVGHACAMFMPRSEEVLEQNRQVEQEDFARDFMKMLRGEGEGLMTMYLFDDGADDAPGSKAVNGEGRKRTRSYGGAAWTEHLAESVQARDEATTYEFLGADLTVQEHAIAEGLIDGLPPTFKVVEYGSGGLASVEKPLRFLGEATGRGKAVTGYVSVDILPRFAIESARKVYDEFNLMSVAVEADFMRHQVNLPTFATDEKSGVVGLIYGGPIANAPWITTGHTKTATDNAVEYLTKIKQQLGPRATLLMTFQTAEDPQAVLDEYTPRRRGSSFESFVLSAFERAIREGVIADPDYDPFRFWEMGVDYDAERKVVRLNAVCTRDHTIRMAGNVSMVSAGRVVNQILSHKWDESDYLRIFERAGFEEPQFHRAPGSDRGLVVARTTEAAARPAAEARESAVVAWRRATRAGISSTSDSVDR